MSAFGTRRIKIKIRIKKILVTAFDADALDGRIARSMHHSENRRGIGSTFQDRKNGK